VVLTVTDSSGNSGSSTQTVRIQGSQVPTSNIRTMITTLVSGLTPFGIVLQLILAAIAGLAVTIVIVFQETRRRRPVMAM